jgi:iron(III) transport system substrate-binding protein
MALLPTHLRPARLASALLMALAALPAGAADAVLNIYSARHYQTDEALYANFTKQTGIKVNRLDGKEDELLERLKNEGDKSPADILITVDATRLEMADQAKLFMPLQSKVLQQRIPDNLRTPNWIAFSTRARVIVYNPRDVKPEWVRTYADLANPRLEGLVCMRSGAHPYNLSLGAAMISHDGEAQTEAWAKGLVKNFARAPKGGDTDQIRSVAAGECGVTISNSYYVARLMRSTKPDERKVMDNVALVWPNQASWGTHINVSGAGILKHAPNKDAAVKFLEYLSSDQAQIYFADGNNEWPAVPGVKADNPALKAMGSFKPDTLNVEDLARKAVQAQKVFDRAGWR